jgi:flavin reductase (DIM6/NTAB) family NADH-FMN oxidoreductase RutF
MNLSLRDAFVQGMARAAQTVSIVTTEGEAGRAGVTVSAMCSVSADGEAPTLLVCVHHLSPAATAILRNGRFAVTLLRDDQRHIADSFAGRRVPPSGDKFGCTDWAEMASGAPRVRDALAAFDCRLMSAERVGTHHILIGAVGDVVLSGAGAALIYSNRAYGAPVRLTEAAPAAGTAAALRLGVLASFGPLILPAILRSAEDVGGPIDLDLLEGDQRQLLEALREGRIDLAFLYDLDIGPGILRTTLAELAPYVLLAEGDPLAARNEVALADLLDRRLILLDAPPSRDYFLSLFEGVGAPRIGYRARSVEMVRGLVAQGLGYSLLATRPASATSYDGRTLVTRPLAGDLPKSRLVLAAREGARQGPATEAFLFHCANAFGLDLE